MRIVILGYIIRGPLGAMCWHHFQYVLGLNKLGHEVMFLEDSDNFPFYDPSTYVYSTNPSYGLAFIQNLFNSYGLSDKWAYYDLHTNTWMGKTKQQALSFCAKADIVINLSAVNPLRDWWTKIPSRVFLDTDCGFTQIKIVTEPSMMLLAEAHTCHFSLGENIGQADCKVPLGHFQWKTTRQPVYLEAWKIAPIQKKGKWTTVMQWDSYEPVEYDNQVYGMKSHAFEEYYDLPKLLPSERFELAVGTCTDAVRQKLTMNGWETINPLTVTKTPWTYQEYIYGSMGEWSVAKQGFVTAKCGYLSERSLNYMASGKPVVVQDTGFSKFYPVGKGLCCFSTLEESVAIIASIRDNYAEHCSKARELVVLFSGSAKVLTKLLKEIN